MALPTMVPHPDAVCRAERVADGREELGRRRARREERRARHVRRQVEPIGDDAKRGLEVVIAHHGEADEAVEDDDEPQRNLSTLGAQSLEHCVFGWARGARSETARRSDRGGLPLEAARRRAADEHRHHGNCKNHRHPHVAYAPPPGDALQRGKYSGAALLPHH